jgi:galactonate dehydratase
MYTKIETDDGFHGWGEAFLTGERAEPVERHIQRMARYLIGRDPHHVKQFRQVMWLDYANQRGGFDLYTAISGLEIACWDIIGKSAGQPIYNLIGGACHARIRVHAYGWGGGRDAPLEVQAQLAQETVARGFTTLKVSPFRGPARTIVTAEDEQHAVDTIRVLRDAVGPKVGLIVEVHRRLAPEIAIRYGRKIEQYEPFYYEEPTTPENLDADVRSRVNIPITAGEDIYTTYGFRPVLEKRAADILNPDVTACCGILGFREIAAMAEPYGVGIAPHQYNLGVGFVASLHLAAAIPNYLTTDYMLNSISHSDEIMVKPLPQPKDGFLDLPTGPGLGVELNETALMERPFRETALPEFATYLEERA